MKYSLNFILMGNAIEWRAIYNWVGKRAPKALTRNNVYDVRAFCESALKKLGFGELESELICYC